MELMKKLVRWLSNAVCDFLSDGLEFDSASGFLSNFDLSPKSFQLFIKKKSEYSLNIINFFIFCRSIFSKT